MSLYGHGIPSQKASIHMAGLADKAIMPASHCKVARLVRLVFLGGTKRGRGVVTIFCPKCHSNMTGLSLFHGCKQKKEPPSAKLRATNSTSAF